MPRVADLIYSRPKDFKSALDLAPSLNLFIKVTNIMKFKNQSKNQQAKTSNKFYIYVVRIDSRYFSDFNNPIKKLFYNNYEFR